MPAPAVAICTEDHIEGAPPQALHIKHHHTTKFTSGSVHAVMENRFGIDSHGDKQYRTTPVLYQFVGVTSFLHVGCPGIGQGLVMKELGNNGLMLFSHCSSFCLQ
jgi:hypothetical protein